MTQFVMHGLLRPADQGRAREGRCVLHLDMDAYFASVEQRDVPIYRGRPLVVCHTSSDFCSHGVVATASYEARPWGVKAGMSVWEARSRCPRACFVHADIPKYLDNARRILRICERRSHRVEVFSIDEVFLDLTPPHGRPSAPRRRSRRPWGVKAGMSVWEARSRCPRACFVHADIPKYLDNARRILRICERRSHRVEVFSIDEVFLDLTPLLRSRPAGEERWEEARRLGAALKEDIRRELRLTASVGIGPNKLVAKMASEFQKPDGLTVIRPEQLPDVLAPLPVDRLVGVGARMRRNLRAMGIETVGDLARAPREALEWRFGIMGRLLWRAARGEDDSPVTRSGEIHEVKSFGHSLSLRGGTDDPEYLENTLLGLVDAVTRRMRRDGYLGRTVNLRLRVGYAVGYARARTLEEYTDLPSPVYAAARDLLRREAASGLWKEPVTTVGVSVSQLRRREEGKQVTIWDCLDPREEKLTAALDALRDRYGEGVVTRASLLGDFALSGMNLAR